MNTATATQIGNSKKERIEVNGEVFLKSVNVGRWTHVVVWEYIWHSAKPEFRNLRTLTTKHSSYEAAARHNEFGRFKDITVKSKTIIKIERS